MQPAHAKDRGGLRAGGQPGPPARPDLGPHPPERQPYPTNSSPTTPATDRYTSHADATPGCPLSSPPTVGISCLKSGHTHPVPVSRPAKPRPANAPIITKPAPSTTTSRGISHVHGTGSGRRRAIDVVLIPC